MSDELNHACVCHVSAADDISHCTSVHLVADLSMIDNFVMRSREIVIRVGGNAMQVSCCCKLRSMQIALVEKQTKKEISAHVG